MTLWDQGKDNLHNLIQQNVNPLVGDYNILNSQFICPLALL